MPPTDDRFIRETLQRHKGKNFVKRILNPQKWPAIDSGKGWVETHRMAWSEVGEDLTPIVYPTIIYDPKKKKLVRLSGDEAEAHARKTGEFIAFEDKEMAHWFSIEYKRGSPPKSILGEKKRSLIEGR